MAWLAGPGRAKMRLSFGGAAPPARLHAAGCEPPAAPVAQRGAGAAERAAAEDQGESAPDLAPARRPLVVVVDNTEAADLLALRDLILVLSEVCRVVLHTLTPSLVLRGPFLMVQQGPCAWAPAGGRLQRGSAQQ